MKLLIFAIITTWSFRGYVGTEYKVIDHPREASIHISIQKGMDAKRIEPDQREYRVYEVNFSDSTIKKIEIPNITFSDGQN